MKRKLLILLAAVFAFQGCSAGGDKKMENLINKVSLYAGSIQDDVQKNIVKSYKIKAFVTDTYYISCPQARKLNVYNDKGNLIKENCFDTTIDLVKGETYYIQIETLGENMSFKIDLFPLNNKIVTPYEIQSKTNLKKYSTKSVQGSPMKAAEIKMEQRKGGTYIYSNIPEAVPSEVVDTIIMQNKELSGECFMSFEHRNVTGINELYMGYRLINTEKHDIYVTVTNVGYQTSGSWIGEKSWMDYYGVQYQMALDKFKEGTFTMDGRILTAQEYFDLYLAFDTNYMPSPIQPITYKIPAGKYIYIIGGTTKDAYQNINVNHTANDPVRNGHCANGNVRFNIINGKARGEFCIYTDGNALNRPDVPVQELRQYENDDFGGRCGSSPIHGVIDNNPVWEVSDATISCDLPVTYQNYYADTLKDSYEPFEPVTDCYYHTQVSFRWLTHLSAQLNHQYCGTDMVDIHGIYQGKEVILSNYIANPTGKIWDFGNWMIEYQENCTFVNHGDKDRKMRYYLVNGSTVFYIIKNMENEILKAGATLFQCTGNLPVYEFVIPAHSKQTFSFQFVLPANTCGSISHYISME